MNPHLARLTEKFPELDRCQSEIERAFLAMKDCFAAGGKILLCGNGGSAADCEHWSGELMKGFLKKRPVPENWRKKLGEPLGSNLQAALPAIPLTGFVSFSTAFANDVAPELVFAQAVWALGNAGDILVGISTSGESRNVLQAFRVARAKGMTTLGLTGESGGSLVQVADICIRVPAKEVHRVQEYHLPVYHALSLMLEDEFFS
jgi:D-sedoheptulose 7-phosphate isomerase